MEKTLSGVLFDSIDSDDVLYTMEEVNQILPHLYELIPKWSRLGVFTTRWPSSPMRQGSKLMSVHDLCALVVLFLLFKCGITGRELLEALSDRQKTFHCERLSWESALFLSTGGWKGQEISRFIEACDFDVKVYISVGFQGERRIEFFYDPESEDHSHVYGAVTILDVREIHRHVKDRIAEGLGIRLEALLKPRNKDLDM
jgi:hypothetical protein